MGRILDLVVPRQSRMVAVVSGSALSPSVGNGAGLDVDATRLGFLLGNLCNVFNADLVSLTAAEGSVQISIEHMFASTESATALV